MTINYTCAGFFTGAGGIETAFENQGFKTIYANEIDNYAVTTYAANHELNATCKDIRDVKCNEIPKFDIMLAGFPCQAFSLAGYRKGFDDEKGRGTLFFELERIFKKKKPKVIFLENVKNLVGHDNGNTFQVILEKLEHAGYHVKHRVLNATEYGNIPQNRERIYIVAFRNKKVYQKFDFPKPIPLTTKLSDVIDFENKVEDKYYYTADKCSFYDTLKEQMTNPNAIYQWRRVYVRENKSGVIPTLTANMGTGGHNVPLILTKHGIRKLTPLECFRAQGYPNNFIIPEGMSNTRAYKQAGNSVVVPVITRIAEEIKKVL
ncbi:DNA cytosine methyltransferase [Marinisporobacter balticus]|uniref:DNA (cytosine-5-)-methyltransferase n=1 Tax=Marinisporobacter balticus TaxID=2018667 RepID=A0A4R2KVA7_9FIRM|nr:DNA cytosine methyltransferase [Marinisporobacter balticus]TCO70655.1 DNA (cytosine-5)-methyltransferase 1 [Marinisporobacter balticus]